MSDGNFNRALLPHTPYHSGLATGRMQMRSKAEEALKDILEEYFPDTTIKQREEIVNIFKEKMRI
ncbi:MAG: hypothetical protein NC113_01740 [Bacteroides sp.]|nr:hypothetical protein [Bacteroides sp.]MCM1446940.1 hypothetical protein [Bacteroides sp.]MCM1516911.1 hypothetical protein [Paraprevotella sp.]